MAHYLSKRSNKGGQKFGRRQRGHNGDQEGKGICLRTWSQLLGRRRRYKRKHRRRWENEAPRSKKHNQISDPDKSCTVGRRRKECVKGSERNEEARVSKKKRHRKQKAETSSDEPSEQSPRTEGPTPIEVEGGTDLKVGKLGSGKFRVIIEKLPQK